MQSGLSAIPLSADVLRQTPPESVALILYLLECIAKLEEINAELATRNAALEKRVVELEIKLNKKSTNSSKPPSSDSPYKSKTQKPDEKVAKKEKRTRKGHERKRLEPTAKLDVIPVQCTCGSEQLGESVPYYTHQVVEIPEIKLIVEDIVLHQAQCGECGKIVKSEIPHDKRSGYGPRLSAMVVELAGVHGNSRRSVQDFVFSIFALSMSLGVIQKIINRAKEAIEPHYDAIREAAQQAKVNYIESVNKV